MQILVTGHQGYIGTVLTPMLAREGHEVVGIDSDFYEKCTFGEPAPDILSIRKDIRDVMERDLEGFDAVIHLAGLSNDPLGDLNPRVTYEINYLSTIRLARLAKEIGVKRFIFSSSCSNYGAAGPDMTNEEADLHPVTPYGHSKVLAEGDLVHLSDSRFSPTILRNATAYGISPRHRFDLVLNNLVAWAYTIGHVYLKSDGTPWRPVVHVEDIARAFIAVLHAPQEKVHNEVFNVGRTEENYQVRELAEIVKETVPGSKIEYSEGAGPDKRCYRVDCDKLSRSLPDYKPQWNVRAGARQLYEAYKKIGLRTEEFEGPAYRRIDHLKQLMSNGALSTDLHWTNEEIMSRKLGS
jgi:nucleoside-diphosphate-sugar epimerase